MIVRDIVITVYIKCWQGFIIALIVCWGAGCANRVAPTGGVGDKTPPEVVETSPASQSLNVSTNRVKVEFSEAVKKPNYGTEIFISPLPRLRPKVVISDNGKKLKINFQEELRPNTTYVIAIKEVEDYYASNKMERVYNFAFSTGDQLDSMKVSGKVQSPILGRGQDEMILLLFPPDSVEDHDILLKLPDYISQSDPSGSFEFQNLRDADYVIYGIKDEDQSASYSGQNEMLALAENPLVTFSDTSNEATKTLYAFFPDDEAPYYDDYLWYNDSVLTLEFSERYIIDSLSVSMQDSLGENSRQIETLSYIPTAEHTLIFSATYLRGNRANVTIENLVDSLGNREDTTFQLRPSRTKQPESPLIIRPRFDSENSQMLFYTIWPPTLQDTQFVFLTDTVSYKPNAPDTVNNNVPVADSIPYVNAIPFDWVIDGFRSEIKLQIKLNPDMPYLLHILGSSLGYEDTVFTYRMDWPDPTELGTWQGVVKVEGYQGPVVQRVLKDNKLVRSSYDTTFAYSLLDPGTYKLRVVLDADSNRIWTPGSLSPYRLPEKIYLSPTETTIRANWDIEEDEIQVLSEMPIKGPPADTTANANNTSGRSSSNVNARNRN